MRSPIIGRRLPLNPDYPLIHSNLGNALLREDQLDETIVHLQQAIRINPNYAEAYNNLGRAFMEKGRLRRKQLRIMRKPFNLTLTTPEPITI